MQWSLASVPLEMEMVRTAVDCYCLTVTCKDQTLSRDDKEQITIILSSVQSGAVWHKPSETIRLDGSLWRWPA